ncbi:hypothetical protein MLD38_020641 [Melastoma candidum]|uniref:Uncharacterized protein n=1 Tax=Melastoma candidum TaxID=119954 RepID=A0ACB9QGJ6_9MYRT|nr:hypothetical protein MLD38_020641 [Melastoma candidum]
MGARSVRKSTWKQKAIPTRVQLKHIRAKTSAIPDTISRAHAVHPISAVQMEWSLWSRDIEDGIVPLCRELRIGIVAYTPLGRGFFGGTGITESLPADSRLAQDYQHVNRMSTEMNKSIYARLEALATTKHECTPAQLAPGWLIQQGDDVVTIPRTSKSKNLETNIGSFSLKLSSDELNEVSNAVPMNEVAGQRNWGSISSLTWQSADTPPLNCNSSRVA